MQGNSGFIEALYGATEWIMRFSVINLLWFVINLPMSIVIILVYFNSSGNEFLFYLLPIVPLIPLLFVPSTVAMFATVRDWVMKRDQSSLLGTYFTYFKDNYKKSFLSGLLLLVIWLIWIVDFYYFNKINGLLGFVFLLIGLALFVYTMIYLCMSVHFRMNRRELIKNTFLVSIGNPLLGFFIIISSFLLFYLSVSKLLFLFPLFTGSVSAYLCFYAFHRFTLKMRKRRISTYMSCKGGYALLKEIWEVLIQSDHYTGCCEKSRCIH